MFSTTVSKSVASAIFVSLSAGATVGVDASKSLPRVPLEAPVALARNSLMVATMANGEIQTQWMPREACERVETAVATGGVVAGVRSDGVSMSITRANCSTPRVEASPAPIVLGSSEH